MSPLTDFVRQYPRLVVLGGAGVSVASGIPAYRGDDGSWQRSQPITLQQFSEQAAFRRRYWARSVKGWGFVARAEPNASHWALAELESMGHVTLLVTQNVDGLHQRAGHKKVIDLHGRVDQVKCLGCTSMLSRSALQQRLLAENPHLAELAGDVLPDGDADVADDVLDDFTEPMCLACGGVLMPNVVFFGGTVPPARVEHTKQEIDKADALLVVGSSLAVYSGFRFCRYASDSGKPLAIVNRGETRADTLAVLKLEADCGGVLPGLARDLGNSQ